MEYKVCDSFRIFTIILRNYLDNVSAYDYVQELFMALKIVNTWNLLA